MLRKSIRRVTGGHQKLHSRREQHGKQGSSNSLDPGNSVGNGMGSVPENGNGEAAAAAEEGATKKKSNFKTYEYSEQCSLKTYRQTLFTDQSNCICWLESL